jgi:uncharacterized phage infection (PIP) family protein YhgE
MDSSNQNQQISIFDIPVTNQNEALQILIYFINVAQKRGTYSIDESAKIYECIKIFKSS